MRKLKLIYPSVILAGERPGGSPLSHAFKVAASVMVPVAGKPALERVMQAIAASTRATGGIICGPTAEVVQACDGLQRLLQDPEFKWLEPSHGPAASARSALQKLNQYPMLLTAGDHALLTPDIIDDFCTKAGDINAGSGADLVVGLVPYDLVRSKWPESKRTTLNFSDGRFCGSNLFAILNPDGLKALSFWTRAEADRKHPWRIARRFGLLALLRYLLRQLSLADALSSLSAATACRIVSVQLNEARAAVDVDSIEDQKLAERILSNTDNEE